MADAEVPILQQKPPLIAFVIDITALRACANSRQSTVKREYWAQSRFEIEAWLEVKFAPTLVCLVRAGWIKGSGEVPEGMPLDDALRASLDPELDEAAIEIEAERITRWLLLREG
jgi:hypothetical protein